MHAVTCAIMAVCSVRGLLNQNTGAIFEGLRAFSEKVRHISVDGYVSRSTLVVVHAHTC